MADLPAYETLRDLDRRLADQYGAYASYYDTSAAPAVIDYYGETPPHAELERLLDSYAQPDRRVLDIGCGAGFSICRLSATVSEAWGIDQDPQLLAAAQRRADDLGRTNVTLIEGNVAVAADLTALPDAHFDLAWSQRGPNLNPDLLRTLRPAAIVVQELVSNADAYPLKEIFGRRAYAPYHQHTPDVLLHYYAELGLLPVSVKDYTYDEFFRDADHFEESLRRGGHLTDWRVPTSCPYNPTQDRPALDRYVRYNATDRGIRVSRRRMVFVFRRTSLAYYPVNGIPSANDAVER